jgi:hypothetical protein
VFTNTDSISGYGFPLVSDGAAGVDFGQIVVEALSDLSPDPSGQHFNLDYITVNTKGLVTGVGANTTRTCWVNFDGAVDTGITFSFNGSDPYVTCTKFGHSYADNQVITVSASNTTLNGNYPITLSTTDRDNVFTFPKSALVTGATTGTLIIPMRIRSSYNIAKVDRLSNGYYKVTFNDSYNNNGYAILATKGSNTPVVDQTIKGDSGCINTVTQTATTVSVSSQYGDTNNCTVYATGSTLSAIPGQPPTLYNRYTYENYYQGGEQGGINTGNLTYTITPAYMAANGYIAVEIGVGGYAQCASGSTTITTKSTVTNMADAVSESTLKFINGGYRKDKLSTKLFVYYNNKMYYKDFYFNDWQTIKIVDPVYDEYTPQAAVFKVPPTDRTLGYKHAVNLSGSGTCDSYITTLLSQFAFTEVKQVVIVNNVVCGRGGACNGGLYGWHYKKNFFIQQ